MTRRIFALVFAFVALLPYSQAVAEKIWLTPETVDESESASGVGEITATVTQPGKYLYVAWENVISPIAPHSHNIFYRYRFPETFNWSPAAYQLTHHILDSSSGALYPQMASVGGRGLGGDPYVTYASSGEGYLIRNLGGNNTSTLDPGYCGTAGNGAVIVSEDPNYHVLYLKCPERQLFHKKFIWTPLESGWTEPGAVPHTSHGVSQYDLAVDVEGNLHVVWSEPEGTPPHFNLYYMRYTEGTGWDADPTLLASSDEIQDMQVAAAYENNVHVVWQDLEPSERSNAAIAHKALQGGSWSTEHIISGTGEHATSPSMTITADNSLHVVWTGEGLLVNYRKWEGDWQPIEQISDTTGTGPHITTDYTSGNLYVFYGAPKPSSTTERQLKLLRFAEPSTGTPEGTGVDTLIDGHRVTFNQVSEAGVTTITRVTDGEALGANFSASCDPPQWFDISTTAFYRGPVEVCLNYDDAACDESGLRLLHHVGEALSDVTTSIDTVANVICGSVLSLSAFTLATPIGSGPEDLVPVPDIKINKSDGPIRLTAEDTIRLSLHLDNNLHTEFADWWLAAESPYGVVFWTLRTGWTYARLPGYQGRLYALDEFSSPVFPVAGLAYGKYRLYFGVDLVRDGAISWRHLYWDSIEVEISR